jgi:hypothetical protein
MTMQRPLVPSLVLSLALLPLAPAGADVQWTQTMRTVGSEAILSNATEFAVDTDSQANDASGPFVASVLADTMVTGVSGTSMSEQDSDLFATGLTGSGSFQTTTDVTDPEGFADVFGRSIINGYFDLDASISYSLTGFVASGGAGTSAQMALFGPGGAIVNVEASPGATVPVDASGTLAPGSYLVTVSAAGNAQEAPPDLMTEASGEWEMSFVLGGATEVPVTAHAPRLRVFPNPAHGSATISLASQADAPARVVVHDAAGRVVRSIDTASGAATWDTRDAAGRRVPAGIYFVTVGCEGRLETGRVTVLR